MRVQQLLTKTLLSLRREGFSAVLQKAGRLARRSYKGAFFKPYIIQRTINEETIPFYIGDIHGEEWYAQPYNHVPELKWIRDNLRKGDVVADCGCHHGFVGVLCSRWVGAKGKVVGFEGSPQNIGIIRQNIELNRLTNFEVRNEVVGGRTGKIRFFADSNGRVTTENGRGTIEVPMVSLDDVFKAETPTLIKIDVEGYEREVLRGCGRLLRLLPKIALEIHCLLFENPVEAVAEVLDLLPLSSYDVWLQTEFNGELIPYSQDRHNPLVISALDKVNLFARPK